MWYTILPSVACFMGTYMAGVVVVNVFKRVTWTNDAPRNWQFTRYNSILFKRDVAKNGDIYKTVGLDALD